MKYLALLWTESLKSVCMSYTWSTSQFSPAIFWVLVAHGYRTEPCSSGQWVCCKRMCFNYLSSRSIGYCFKWTLRICICHSISVHLVREAGVCVLTSKTVSLWEKAVTSQAQSLRFLPALGHPRLLGQLVWASCWCVELYSRSSV